MASLGTRVLDLCDFARRCEIAQCKTHSELKTELNRFIDHKVIQYESALAHILAKFAKVGDKSFIAELPIKKPIALQRFCELTGKESKSIVELLGETHSHPFYVDPLMKTASMGSHFIKSAVKKLL